MNGKTVSHHSRGGDNNECALVTNDLNYNTFSSGDASIDCENWLYAYQNEAAPPQPGERADETRISEKRDDPYDEACSRNGNTYWGTVFHIYVISMGPSLFLVPKYFFAVGYFAASTLVFVIFFVYWHCVKMIVWSEGQVCQLKRRPCTTYPETVFHCFDAGPRSVKWFAPCGYFCVRILCMVTWSGVFELAMISSNFRLVCLSAFNLALDSQSSTLIIFVPMLLLTWVYRMKYLVPLSMVADSLLLFCFLTVVTHIILDPQPLSVDPDVGSLEYVPPFFGPTLYALNVTALMLPLKHEMKEPRRFDAKWGVLNVTFPVISFVYVLFGLFCSMKFGSELLRHDTVIECLGASRRTLDIVVALYTLSIALQYPLVTYVVFETIWSGFLRNKQNKIKHKTCCEYAVRTLVYLASFLVSYSLPQLNLILAVCGTICLALDSLLFPALINSLLMWKLNGNVRKVKVGHVKNGFIGLIAVFVVYAGLYVSISQIATSVSGESGNNTDQIRMR